MQFFCLNLHITCGDMKENVSGRFFSEHSVVSNWLYFSVSAIGTSNGAQIYGFSAPSAALELQNRVSACVAVVSLWMCSNRLQLNPAKTEILWFSSSRRQFQIPQVPFRVGTATIAPSSLFVTLVSTSTRVSA